MSYIVYRESLPKRWTHRLAAGLLLAASGGIGPAGGGEADVLDAEITRAADGRYTVSVTVRHADEGWDHYADRWELLDGEGNLLAVRELAHPHENEQPFTRSLTGVRLPEGLAEVTIRARDSRHGYGGETLSLPVPQ